MQQFFVQIVVKCEHEKDARSYLEMVVNEYCGGPGEFLSIEGEPWHYLGLVKFTNNSLDDLSLKEFQEEVEDLFEGCELLKVQEA